MLLNKVKIAANRYIMALQTSDTTHKACWVHNPLFMEKHSKVNVLQIVTCSNFFLPPAESMSIVLGSKLGKVHIFAHSATNTRFSRLL